tara:strand:- start:3408 stop:3899 length:492 start_codon:yes stop_codon:yes gene_type:complete
MILISHRGNISGCDPCRENTPSYIDEALDRSYDAEIDLWADSTGWWLGHDKPQIKITQDWLEQRSKKLWVHCKSFGSLEALRGTSLRFFYHNSESYTLISNGLIWAHNTKEVNEFCVIPLLSAREASLNRRFYYPTPVFGICSDYVETISNMNFKQHRHGYGS